MDYYRVDARNLTFAELWRISKPGFPLLALLKILRIRLPDRTAIPYPLRVVPLDESELDVDGRRARMRREFEALEADGFHLKLLYSLPILSPDSTTFAAAFLSNDTWIYAVVLDAVTRVGAKTIRTTRLSLVTPLADGRFLATSSRRDMNNPPEFEGEIVRGSRERLIRRHRDRMREAASSPRSIDGEDLQSFISELERRAGEFQIARRVWVPLSPREVEKAREYKPRGGHGWQLGNTVLGWVIAGALSLAWTLGGVRGCGSAPGTSSDVDDVWSEQVRIVHSCAEGSMSGVRSKTQPQVATIAGLFDSAAQAAAMEAPAEAALGSVEEAERGEFHQVGNALFYRTTGGVLKDARPVYDTWTGSAVSVDVLGEESDGRTLVFTAAWTLSGDQDDERATSIEVYLDTALLFPLLPPWAAGDAGQPAVGPREANARRTLHRLQKAEREELMASMLGPFATIKAIWTGLAASFGDRDWRKQIAEQQAERIEGLRALAKRLVEEDPTLDAEVLELYVTQQDRIGQLALEGHTPSNPFEEDAGEGGLRTEGDARLRERLAALPPLEEADGAPTDEPEGLVFDFAERGWVRRSDEEIGIQVFLADPAVSSPAILDYICEGEVAEVTFGFSPVGW